MAAEIQYGGRSKKPIRTTAWPRRFEWYQFEKDRLSGSRDICFFIDFQYGGQNPIWRFMSKKYP